MKLSFLSLKLSLGDMTLTLLVSVLLFVLLWLSVGINSENIGMHVPLNETSVTFSLLFGRIRCYHFSNKKLPDFSHSL